MTQLIQHLNIIVDPTTEGLLIDDPPVTAPYATMADYSTNNLSNRNPFPYRLIRVGGSGQQPNRNKKKSGIKLVQQAFDFNDAFPTTFSLPKSVTKGNLIVFIATMTSPVGNSGTDDPGPITFSDNFGSSYSQVGGYVTYGGPFSWTVGGNDAGPWHAGISLSMFYALANGTGALTISASAAGAQACNLWLLEYSGIASIPFDGSAQNIVTAFSLAADMFNLGYTSNSIPVTGVIGGGVGELVIAAFMDCSGSTDFNSTFKDEFSSAAGLVVDCTTVKSNVTVAGTAFSPYVHIGPANTDIANNPMPTEFVYLSLGASFKGK